MRIRDIEKEGFIKFSNKNKDEEVTQEEYDQLIESTYISQVKYGRVNEKLKEKYNNLKKRTKKINNITSIAFISNAKLNESEYYNLIVVEDNNTPSLIYDITNGTDNSFSLDKIITIDNKTLITELYAFSDNSFQTDFQIGYMSTITLYKNCEILNTISDTLMDKSNYIEFKDQLGQIFYIDIINNNLYINRNNYEIVKNNKTKQTIIYEYNKSNNISYKIFKDIKYDILSLFFEY